MAAKNIKVSQATIDRIKRLGMTAALKKAGSSSNAEYIEGIRRMYGERRLSAARGSAPVAKSPDAARAAAAKKAAVRPVAKSPDEARAKYTVTTKATSAKKVGTKPAAGKLPYYYSDAERAYVKAYGKPTAPKKSAPKSKATAQQKAYGKARAGGMK